MPLVEAGASVTYATGACAIDDPLAALGSAAVAIAPDPVYLVFARRWRAQAEALQKATP